MAAHKMKGGRWCVWLDLGSDPVSGQRIRKRVEARTKREAESKAAALRERHARGENVNEKPRTLGELLDEWLATTERQGKATNTILAYERAMNSQLRPRLGAVSVPKLRTREIQHVFNDLADRWSPSYVRLLKTVLVQALNFAIEQNEITINPAKMVRIPAVKSTPGRSLTPEEVHAVLVACEGQRYGLAVRLALMGLRRGELPGLRWEDFNEVTGTLMVCRQIQRVDGAWVPITPKRNSTRTLTLGPKIAAALRQYRWQQAEEREVMGWAESGYIFVSTRDGGVCPPSTIYEAWRDIIRAAGVQARLHDARHTAGTTLLANGEDIGTVSGVLGHATPLETAKTYAHALPAKVAGASQRLDDLYE